LPLQKTPSAQRAFVFTWLQTAAPLTVAHESTVQAMLSLQLTAVPALQPVVPGVAFVSHTSAPSQALPLLQNALLAVKMHFFCASLQESEVQSRLSLQTMGVPATQPVVPLADGFVGSHFSTPVQNWLSLQSVS
jgi:hypothetical protein